MDAKKLATDKQALISAAQFKPLRDAVVALYLAASYPPFQPDQIIGSLGIIPFAPPPKPRGGCGAPW
jgi:hypothetical protein